MYFCSASTCAFHFNVEFMHCTNNKDIHPSKCQQLFQNWSEKFHSLLAFCVHHLRLSMSFSQCSLKYADGFVPNLKDGNEDKWIFRKQIAKHIWASKKLSERAEKKTQNLWNGMQMQISIQLRKLARAHVQNVYAVFFSWYFVRILISLLEIRKNKQWQVIKRCILWINCLFRPEQKIWIKKK